MADRLIVLGDGEIFQQRGKAVDFGRAEPLAPLADENRIGDLEFPERGNQDRFPFESEQNAVCAVACLVRKAPR